MTYAHKKIPACRVGGGFDFLRSKKRSRNPPHLININEIIEHIWIYRGEALSCYGDISLSLSH